MAEHQLPKLNTRVRFPSSAPHLPTVMVFESVWPAPLRVTKVPTQTDRLHCPLPNGSTDTETRSHHAANPVAVGVAGFFKRPLGLLEAGIPVAVPSGQYQPNSAQEIVRASVLANTPRYTATEPRGTVRVVASCLRGCCCCGGIASQS